MTRHLVFTSIVVLIVALLTWPTLAGTAYLPLILKNAAGAPAGGQWELIVQEDFEGAFPGPWVVGDQTQGGAGAVPLGAADLPRLCRDP